MPPRKRTIGEEEMNEFKREVEINSQ